MNTFELALRASALLFLLGCGRPAPEVATAGPSRCAVEQDSNMTFVRHDRGFQLALPGLDWELECAPGDGVALLAGSSRQLGTVMSVLPFERTDVQGDADILQAILARLEQANTQNGLRLANVSLAQETVGELSRLVLSYTLEGASIDQAGACSVHAWSVLATANGVVALHFSFTGEAGRCTDDVIGAVRGSTLPLMAS